MHVGLQHGMPTYLTYADACVNSGDAAEQVRCNGRAYDVMSFAVWAAGSGAGCGAGVGAWAGRLAGRLKSAVGRAGMARGVVGSGTLHTFEPIAAAERLAYNLHAPAHHFHCR